MTTQDKSDFITNKYGTISECVAGLNGKSEEYENLNNLLEKWLHKGYRESDDYVLLVNTLYELVKN